MRVRSTPAVLQGPLLMTVQPRTLHLEATITIMLKLTPTLNRIFTDVIGTVTYTQHFKSLVRSK
jgi:hypothetical protein